MLHLVKKMSLIVIFISSFYISGYCEIDQYSAPNGQSFKPSKVNVAVNYGTFSSDAIRLIHKQIYPTWLNMSDYLNVTFIPYGRTRREWDDHWIFKCELGEEECFGNKVQACAVDILRDNPTSTLYFVGCFMTFNNFYPFSNTCFEEATDNEEYRERFDNCVNSEEGDALVERLADIVEQTFPNNAPFAPTLLINGIYNRAENEEAIDNFRQVVCRYIPQYRKPKHCFV